MRTYINLTTKRYVDGRKISVWLSIVTLMLATGFIYMVIAVIQNMGELRRLNSEISVFEGKFKSSGAGVKESDYKNLLARINFTNDLIDNKNMNWLGLLNRLEEAVPDGVAIASLEPDLKKNELKISCVALKFANLRKLIENLENSNYFTNVTLLSQRTTSAGENQSGFEFDISCKLDYRRL